MNEKLNPIRVKLLKWDNPDSTTLNLNFEKVQPYTSSRDFTKPGFPITIYSDFGYVNITLRGEFIYEKENCWLNEYINDDEIFLEEEVENELTFWEGTHESRYDWTTSYSICFDYKQIEHLPIDQEEWKKKYSEMTLSWDKLFHERHDILHNDFLSLFIDVTKGKINTFMPDSKNEDLILFKNSLKNSLDSWLESFEEQKKEMEDLYINSTDKTHFKQDNVNSELKGFWKKLIERFK